MIPNVSTQDSFNLISQQDKLVKISLRDYTNDTLLLPLLIKNNLNNKRPRNKNQQKRINPLTQSSNHQYQPESLNRNNNKSYTRNFNLTNKSNEIKSKETNFPNVYLPKINRKKLRIPSKKILSFRPKTQIVKIRSSTLS